MPAKSSGPTTSPVGPSGRSCQWCQMKHPESECPFLLHTDRLGQGLFLAELMQDAAELGALADRAYAVAFLEAQGTDQQRRQAAILATIKQSRAVKDAAARVAGYQHIIGGANHETSD